MDRAMVACFPTPVDAQGEVLLLELEAAGDCDCKPLWAAWLPPAELL
jgi:hypothetical protein